MFKLRIGNVVFLFFRAPNEPEVKQVRKGVDIEKDFKKSFPKCQVMMTDENYRISTFMDVERLVNSNFHVSRKWVWDIMDCDNKARSLWSLMADLGGNLAFGYVCVQHKSGRHALNCFLDHAGNWWYVEPENNTIFMMGGIEAIKLNYKPYFVIF